MLTRSLRLPPEPPLSWAASLLETSLTEPGSASPEPSLPLVTDSGAEHQPLTEALTLTRVTQTVLSAKRAAPSQATTGHSLSGAGGEAPQDVLRMRGATLGAPAESHAGSLP